MPTLVELFGLSLYTAKIPVRSSAHYWRRFMLFRMEHRQAILSAHQCAKLQHIASNDTPAAFKTLSVVLINSDPSDSPQRRSKNRDIANVLNDAANNTGL